MRRLIPIYALCVICGSALADDTPLAATAAPYAYALDTLASPRLFKTAADVAARPVPYRTGETVSLSAPNGAASALVSDAASAGTVALPINAGGLWTATNSKQGTATFLMRYSYYGTQGAGTAADPAKIVDADELSDLADAGTAGDGYVFTLLGGDDHLAKLRLPVGYTLEEAGNDNWRIVATADGLLYSWSGMAYKLDSKGPGPDRKAKTMEAFSVAFSGDNWSRTSEAASKLILTSPAGSATTNDLAGTGLWPVCFDQKGPWGVSLVAGDKTLSASINVTSVGTLIIIR